MKFLNILKVNKEVKKIVDYVTKTLTDKGLYEEGLDIQIFSVACQIYQMNKLMDAYISSTAIIENDVRGGGTSYKKNPLINDLTNVSESLRKNLKALGLNFDATVKGVDEKNPLATMIDAMNAIDDE